MRKSSSLKAKLEISADLGPAKLQLDAFIHEMEALEKTRAKLSSQSNLRGQDKEALKKEIAEIDKQIAQVSKNAQRYLDEIHRLQLSNAKTLHEQAKKHAQEMLAWAKRFDAETNRTYKSSLAGSKAQETADKNAHNVRLSNLKAEENAQRNLHRLFMQNLASQKQAQNANHQAALLQLKTLETAARNAATAAVAASRVRTQQTIQGLNDARTTNVQAALPGVVAGAESKILTLGRLQASDNARNDALGIGRGFLSGGLRGDRLHQFQGFWKTYQNEIKNLDARLATDLAGLYQKHFGSGRSGFFGRFFGGGSNSPGMQGVTKFASQLFGIYGAGYAAKKIGDTIIGATTGGASAYMDYEKKRALLTGAVNTNYDLYQGNKRLVDPGEIARASITYSQDLFKQVRQKAIESPLNLKDLFDVVPVALSSLGSKGMKVNQVLDVANLSASIGKMMGYREGSYIDDIRALGNAGPIKNAQSFAAMGYTKDSWKKLQGMSGDEMYQDIMKHGAAFKKPLEDFKDSLTSAVDQVKDSIYSSGIRIGEKMAPTIKAVSASITEQLKQWEADGTVDKFANALSGILTATSQFMKFIVEKSVWLSDKLGGLLSLPSTRDEANQNINKNNALEASAFANSLRSKSELEAGLVYTARKAAMPTNKIHEYLMNPNTKEATGYFAQLEKARVSNKSLSDFDDYKKQRIQRLTNLSTDAVNLLASENYSLDNAANAFHRRSAGFDELRAILDNPYEKKDFLNSLQQARDESYYYPGSLSVSRIVQTYQGVSKESKRSSKLYNKSLDAIDANNVVSARPKNSNRNTGSSKIKGLSTGTVAPNLARYAERINQYEAEITALENERNSGYTSELRSYGINSEIAAIEAKIGAIHVEMANEKAGAKNQFYVDGNLINNTSGLSGSFSNKHAKQFQSGGSLAPFTLPDKMVQGILNKQRTKDVDVIEAEGRARNLQSKADAANIEYLRLVEEYRNKQSAAIKAFMSRVSLDSIEFALGNPSLVKASQRGPLERSRYIGGPLKEQIRGDIDELQKSGINSYGATLMALGRGGKSLSNFDVRNQEAIDEEERIYREQRNRERYERKYLLAGRARQNSTLFGGDLTIAKNSQMIEDLQKINLDHKFDALIYALQRNTDAINIGASMKSTRMENMYSDAYNSAFGTPLNNKDSYIQNYQRSLTRIMSTSMATKRLILSKRGVNTNNMMDNEVNDAVKAVTLTSSSRKGYNDAAYMDQLTGGISNALPQMLRGYVGEGIGTIAGSYSNLDLNLNGSFTKLLKGKGRFGSRLSRKEWGLLGENVIQSTLPGMLGKNSFSNEGSQLGGMAASMGAFAGLGAWAGPVGALGGALLGSLFKRKSGPSPEEQAIKEWQKRVVDLLNNIDKSLRPQEDYYRSVKNEIFGSASRYWSGRAHSGLGFQNSLGAM